LLDSLGKSAKRFSEVKLLLKLLFGSGGKAFRRFSPKPNNLVFVGVYNVFNPDPGSVLVGVYNVFNPDPGSVLVADPGCVPDPGYVLYWYELCNNDGLVSDYLILAVLLLTSSLWEAKEDLRLFNTDVFSSHEFYFSFSST